MPPNLTETVPGLINRGVIMGPTLLQPAVGWMLDRGWNGQMLNGTRIYDLAAYHGGFNLMFGWIVAAFVLLYP
ncbi:MAG: hypothetical protein WCD88_04255 [Desulfobacterales bacterium]